MTAPFHNSPQQISMMQQAQQQSMGNNGNPTFASPPKLLSETTSTGIPAFPWKLHDVLEDAEKKGFTSIVSWTMGGRAFKVHNQRDFESKIMTQYFNQTQYKSFQRQLNIYNFVRITCGEAKGSYTHDFLIRGKPDICRLMVRTKIKRKGSKSMSNSSEKLNELAKQPNSVQVAAVRPSRSLDDMTSVMMARSSLNGGGNGFQNQVFGQMQEQQGFNDNSSRDESQCIFFPQGANSNQTASALQRSFIPNQIMIPSVVSSGSIVGNNNANAIQFLHYTKQSQQQEMHWQSFLSPQASPQPGESRRLSLKLFEDITRDLSSNQTAPTVGTGGCDVSMAGSTSHHDTFQEEYVLGEAFDHIFDDDIESVGEPVAFEDASPIIRNTQMSTDMAEGLLRSMFSNQN